MVAPYLPWAQVRRPLGFKSTFSPRI
jgi:hypothetical protein